MGLFKKRVSITHLHMIVYNLTHGKRASYFIYVRCAVAWYVCVQITYAKQSSSRHATIKVYILPNITLHIIDGPFGGVIASSPTNNHLTRSRLISLCVPDPVPVSCDLCESLQLFGVGFVCVDVQ